MKKRVINLVNKWLNDSWFQIVEREWSYAIFISEPQWAKKVYIQEKQIVKQLFMVWVEEEEWPNMDWFSMDKFLAPNKNIDVWSN